MDITKIPIIIYSSIYTVCTVVLYRQEERFMIYVIETKTTLKLSYTAKFTCFVKLLLVIIIRGCAHCVQESSISIIIDLIKFRDMMPCNTAVKYLYYEMKYL